jgi:homoserine dehydrogenase
VTADDVAAMTTEGRVLRLIATSVLAEDGAIEASVVPTAVPAGSPFGRCDGVLNRIEVDGQPVGRVAFEGPGAGGPAAGAAVLSDLVAVARGIGSTWAGLAAATEVSGLPVRPVAAECVVGPSGACYPVSD